MEMTQHAQTRLAQRNLKPSEIPYIMAHGMKFHKDGALIYFLRRCDIPWRDQANNRWMRLEGTALIFTKDGETIITMWRNRKNGLLNIRRKPEYNGRESSRSTMDG